MHHGRLGRVPQPLGFVGCALVVGGDLRVPLFARFLDFLVGLGVLRHGALPAVRLVAPRLEAEPVLPVLDAASRHGAVGKDDVTAVAFAVAATPVAAMELAVGY